MAERAMLVLHGRSNGLHVVGRGVHADRERPAIPVRLDQRVSPRERREQHTDHGHEDDEAPGDLDYDPHMHILGPRLGWVKQNDPERLMQHMLPGRRRGGPQPDPLPV